LFAKKLSKDSKLNGEVFNFGSKYQKNFTVLTMIKKMKNYWHKVNWKIKRKNKNEIYYESKLLRLNCIKAKKRLKWNSILNINETIGMTINWYKKFYSEPKKIRDLALSQIKTYEKLILKRL
jgi:CDP-glucose 4,6-dehydratase